MGQCVNYRSICAVKESLRSHLRRKVSLCYYCVVAGCLLVASCNVGLRGVGFHRTDRRRAASYQWYDAAILLGLNTFGTLGHTCFALPEQPPCAPCFARTHRNSTGLLGEARGGVWRVFSRTGINVEHKRGCIWGFWGALITMEGFAKRHSQRLMDFVSAECQVQGNLVTLDFCEPHFSTQHHRFRGGRPTRLGPSYSNRARNHTVPYHRFSSPFVYVRGSTFSREKLL